MARKAKDKQADEYRKQMGEAALYRQSPIRPSRSKVSLDCVCGWKLEKGVTPGPHHKDVCPLYETAE